MPDIKTVSHKVITHDMVTWQTDTTLLTELPGPDELLALAVSYCRPGTDLKASYWPNPDHFNVWDPVTLKTIIIVQGLGFEHGTHCAEWINTYPDND